jgi:hypothetical protein
MKSYNYDEWHVLTNGLATIILQFYFILCHHLILLSNKNNSHHSYLDTLLAECLSSNSEQSTVKMERLDRKLLQT